MSAEGRLPFANGTEVDWFRFMRCDGCVYNHPEGGGCDDFVFGVVVEERWPDLLVQVPTSSANPLGVECSRFEPSS